MTIKIPEGQKDFLQTFLIFEDAAGNLSEAVQWCISACMKIEQKYGIDAMYVALEDIRLKENQPT